MFLNLLLLCGILSQGFIEIFTDENTESLDTHVREKRVINRIPGEDRPIPITLARHVVMIKFNNRISCTGSILAPHVVITASRCIIYPIALYHVVANSARTSRGNTHDIEDIKSKSGGHPLRPIDGISLLAVTPRFEIGTYGRPIQLHSSPLLPGLNATVAGWGYNCGNADTGTNYARDLRKIEVTIISHQECVNRYQPYVRITDLDVCTYDPQKHCGHNDYGAGLIVNGYLAGVFIHGGPADGIVNLQYPDVFAIVQHSEYREWITTNVRNIEAVYLNRQQ